MMRRLSRTTNKDGNGNRSNNHNNTANGRGGGKRKGSISPPPGGIPLYPGSTLTGYRSTTLVLVYPYANNKRVLKLLLKSFEENSIEVASEGEIPNQLLEDENLLDQHFATYAQLATSNEQNAKRIVNQTAYNLLTERGDVASSTDAILSLKISPKELYEAWNTASAQDGVGRGLTQLGPSCYTAPIPDDLLHRNSNSNGNKAVHVVNGFYPYLRESFRVTNQSNNNSVHYFVVQWNSQRTSWKELNTRVFGDGGEFFEPAIGSIRHTLRKDWHSLKLKRRPDWLHLGVYVSRSPLQSLIDRITWLRLRIETDAYGRSLLQRGITLTHITKWKKNPLVYSSRESHPNQKVPILSLVDSLSPDICTESCLNALRFERQIQEESATTIQAWYRGNTTRKNLQQYARLKTTAYNNAKHFLRHTNPQPHLDDDDDEMDTSGASPTAGSRPRRRSSVVLSDNIFNPHGAGGSKRGFPIRNYSIIFIPTDYASELCVSFVKELLTKCNITITKQTCLSSTEVIDHDLLKYHFTTEIRQMQAETLHVPTTDFKLMFGVKWADVVADQRAFVACDAAKMLNIDENTLALFWVRAVQEGQVLYCRDGVAIGKVCLPDKVPVFIWCGNYLMDKQKLIKPGGKTYCFAIEWDAKMLSWVDFRKRVIGVGKSPKKHSLNGLIFSNLKVLALNDGYRVNHSPGGRSSPTTTTTKDSSTLGVDKVAVITALSLTQAMVLRKAWFGAPLEEEPLARALKISGFHESVIRGIAEDPEVKVGNVVPRPLSRATRDFDLDQCLDFCELLKEKFTKRYRKRRDVSKRKKARGTRGSRTPTNGHQHQHQHQHLASAATSLPTVAEEESSTGKEKKKTKKDRKRSMKYSRVPQEQPPQPQPQATPVSEETLLPFPELGETYVNSKESSNHKETEKRVEEKKEEKEEEKSETRDEAQGDEQPSKEKIAREKDKDEGVATTNDEMEAGDPSVVTDSTNDKPPPQGRPKEEGDNTPVQPLKSASAASGTASSAASSSATSRSKRPSHSGTHLGPSSGRDALISSSRANIRRTMSIEKPPTSTYNVEKLITLLKQKKGASPVDGDGLILSHILISHMLWARCATRLEDLVQLGNTYFGPADGRNKINSAKNDDATKDIIETVDSDSSAVGGADITIDTVKICLEALGVPLGKPGEEELIQLPEGGHDNEELETIVFPTQAHRWATAWVHLKFYGKKLRGGGAEEQQVTLTSAELRQNFGDMNIFVQLEVLEDGSSLDAFASSVNLSGGDLMDDDITILCQSLRHDAQKEIQLLNLYNNKLTEVGAKRVGDLLKKCDAIKELSLGVNQIGDKGAKGLAKALEKNNSLTTLKLSDNKIGDEGVKALCNSLVRNSVMMDVDLTANNIGPNGGNCLITLLQHNYTLSYVALLGNQGLPITTVSTVRKLCQINQVPELSTISKRTRKEIIMSAGASNAPPAVSTRSDGNLDIS